MVNQKYPVRSSYNDTHKTGQHEMDKAMDKALTDTPAETATTVSVFVSAIGVEKSPETGLWEIKLPARPLLRAERQMLNTLFPNTMVQVQDLLNKEALLHAIANQ